MSRTLIDITSDMQALDELLFEVGGDLTDPRVEETITKWFAELDSDFTVKLDNYAALITTLQGRAKLRADEAARLAQRSKIDQNSADWLKLRMKAAIEARGMKKVETDRYTITIAANGGKVPIDVHDPNAVPRELCRHIPETWIPDSDMIRAKLESGAEVPGAVLMARGSHIRIK